MSATTAADARTCAEIVRRHARRHRQDAINLLENAPPPASDLAAHDHAKAVALGWLEVASGYEAIEQAHLDLAEKLDTRAAS